MSSALETLGNRSVAENGIEQCLPDSARVCFLFCQSSTFQANYSPPEQIIMS